MGQVVGIVQVYTATWWIAGPGRSGRFGWEAAARSDQAGRCNRRFAHREGLARCAPCVAGSSGPEADSSAVALILTTTVFLAQANTSKSRIQLPNEVAHCLCKPVGLFDVRRVPCVRYGSQRRDFERARVGGPPSADASSGHAAAAGQRIQPLAEQAWMLARGLGTRSTSVDSV